MYIFIYLLKLPVIVLMQPLCNQVLKCNWRATWGEPWYSYEYSFAQYDIDSV